MWDWLKRKQPKKPRDGTVAAAQPPRQVFPWPRGAVITAVDEVVLALPVALFDKDRPMGEFVFGPDDMEFNVPPEGETFFIRLKPGMSVSLAKSCDSFVVADDSRPRRLSVRLPPMKG
jgi:hypothetical protein